MSLSVDPASFRDPSGFVFYRDGILHRQVQPVYRDHYDRLMASGLYRALAADGLLTAHSEEPIQTAALAGAYRVLRPERVPFVSYPYEWSFSQLKDAALATLNVQKRALDVGLSLKDASAYNIQFNGSRPVLIDTLSFECYQEGLPWVAYRQFCQHFLAPLALMGRTDIRLSALLRANIDGIPLDLASRLLPRATWLKPGLLAHIHLHGAAQKRYAGEGVRPAAAHVTRTAVQGLVDSLETTVKSLRWSPTGTTWAEYYANTNYSDAAMEAKKHGVAALLDRVDPSPATVWDLGANTGVFSRLAADRGAYTVAWDIDPAAVERNYLDCRERDEKRLLPLVGDLTNPSPALGWAGQERRSLGERGPVGALLALALVHHLAIANNVPLPRIASFFASIGSWAIVEFVPKSDSQVRRLLASREDIFPDYTRQGFEAAFAEQFEIVDTVQVIESDRLLYLLRGRVL